MNVIYYLDNTALLSVHKKHIPQKDDLVRIKGKNYYVHSREWNEDEQELPFITIILKPTLR